MDLAYRQTMINEAIGILQKEVPSSRASPGHSLGDAHGVHVHHMPINTFRAEWAKL